jgi:hypothetical protein
VGIGQIIAMIRQEKWMRKNVKVARDSADAASSTVKVMKQTAQRDLRARVFVMNAKRMGNPDAGPFSVEVKVKNYGKVPAYACTFAVNLVVRPNPLNEPLIPLQWTGQEPKMVLPPRGQIKIIRSLPEGTFAKNQHQLVIAGSWAVYVYGEIRYRNGFGTSRFSRFRMKCCEVDYSLCRFSFCEEGNEAN